ncbi:MAG: T9SS type A sorting domain-containing protein [bacterium]|nr:T9SS type A sorting domain-containing protein [bacterium]
MRHLRSAILIMLAVFASQVLAIPSLPQPPQQQDKRDHHKKNARPDLRKKSVRPAKGGSVLTAPAVKGVVADDFKMNTDSLPMFLYRDGNGIAATMLENGNFICAWADYRDGNMNIRFQRFTSACQPASAVFTADAGRAFQFLPKVAVRSNGAFAISWLSYDDIGYQHVYSRAFDPSGNPLDTTIRADGGNSQHAMSQALAATDSGYAVIWTDYRIGDYRVFLQMVDTLGHLSGVDVRVSTLGSGQQFYNAAGRAGQGFIVAWSDNGSGNCVYARRYDARGDTIGPVLQANGASTNMSSRPDLCATDSGFTIAWDDWRNSSNYEIYLQRFDTAGALLGGNVNVTNYSYNASYPSIASRNGQTVVAWQDTSNGNYDVYAQWYKPNGDTLGGQAMLNDDATSYSQQRPVALAGDSGWTLCWLDSRNSDVPVIYGQYYDTSIAAQGANLMLSDSTAGLQGQWDPSVTAGKDGNFLAVWYDDRNSDGNNEDIYGRLYSGNGAALTPDFLISDTSYSPGNRSAYEPKVAGLADGSYLVAWYDYRSDNDYDIYGQRLDASGIPVGGNHQISTTGTGFNDYEMSIAAFDSGYGVFWYAYDPSWSYSNIYGRLFKTNGDSVGTTINISDTVPAHYTGSPSAAANDSGIVVSWQDYRDASHDHIYGQRILLNGSLLGGNYLIGDSLDNDQYDPSIAGTNSGFMVTWYNYYGDSSSIAGQRLDAAGQPVDTNYAVSTQSGLYHECPSVTVSPDGDRYAVIWYTRTGGRYVLLSQLYQNGLPQGVNEMVVDTTVWIDAETYGGQSIAATNDRLFFTWYGFKNNSKTYYDVYGKVTDWNGTGVANDDGGGSTGLTASYALQACRPNPSSGRVSFGYQLPKTSKVSLTVYNIAGQVVKRFDLGTKPAGQHKVDWNGNRVAAGVYFYRLQAGDFSSTKKLMIVK